MLLNKKLIILLLVYSAFIFAIGYTVTTTYEPVSNLFTGMFLDSLDTLDNPPAPPSKDVSQMFNERGFYKSNSFSFDENEIINDFNGNLMYEIPLYNFKLAGDLTYEMKLIYNGSVGHQINLGTIETYESQRATHNINFPEWILDFNGFGVQVFNFETRFFTEPVTSQYEISGNYLNALIPGYHYDDRLISVETFDRDRINILAGDGSVITLVNKSWQNGHDDSLRYMGSYHSEDKESHIKARVSFDLSDQETDPGYRNRVVEVMKGDGLVYVFREYKVAFEDFAVNASIVKRKRPQMLLLNKVIDRFGYSIDLAYEFVIAPNTISGVLFGRPLLAAIQTNLGGNMMGKADVGFMYSGNAIKLFNSSGINGNYLFRLYQTVNYSNGASVNNRGFVSRISNPLFQEAVVLHEAENKYIRKLNQVPNPVHNNSITLNFNNLYRIKNFKNFLGGKRGYEYFPSGVNTIEISYSSNYLRSSNYQGYGRDPFYSNMLYRKFDTTESNVAKSRTQFDYYYLDVDSDIETYPVDEKDSNKTTRSVLSLDNTTKFDTPAEMTSVRRYRIYPVRYETPAYQPEVLSFNGITKLIYEDHIEVSSGIVKQRNEYTYSIGSKTGGSYPGSMLMDLKKSYLGGVLREWEYDYTHLDNAPDSVIMFKKETDPFDNYSEVYLDTNFIELNFLLNNGKAIFYQYGIPLKELRFNSGDDKLAEKRYAYIKDSVNSLGYYGQLLNERVFNAPGFSDYIETAYEYYKKDTTGASLYSPAKLPHVEGNLKIVSRPNGQEERYFYYPVSKSEDQIGGDQYAPPSLMVSYKVKYNTGSIALLNSDFKDSRLPTRIDYYKVSGGSRDTIKKNYFEYNEAGAPIKIVNENNFLTEIKYQAVHRVSSITLPGDFSTVSSYDSVYFNRDTIDTYIIVPSVGWGNMNATSSYDSLYATVHSIAIQQCNYFQMNDISNDNKLHPFIKFNYNNLKYFTEIDSALLYVAPLSYTLTQDWIPVDQSDFSIKIHAAYSLQGTNYTNCASAGDNVERGKVLKHDYSINSDINTSGTGCSYNPHYLEIKSLLQDLADENRNLYGIYLTPQTTIPHNEGDVLRYQMNFTNCEHFWAYYWSAYAAPKISLYGSYEDIDTLIIPVVQGGTYAYRYDDEERSVMVYSRLNHTPNKLKKIQYLIDGFGNIKQKNLYKSADTFDSLVSTFNYLNALAENIDAKDNSTKLSYDFLGRQKKTTNEDNSSSANDFAYDNNLASYFGGTFSGFVEKQTFTDETNRTFNKYFDAVGNLLREEKFVAATGGGDPVIENYPFDPDTTFEGQDFPSNIAALTTDYKYDKLYRLIEVRTPGGDTIKYYYDGYGRQSQRNTPDAGATRYSYDKNGNLILSQDAKQKEIYSSLFTLRSYDGLNRLLMIADIKYPGIPIHNGPMGDTLLPSEIDSPPGADSMYIVNVYDTVTTAIADIFSGMLPSGYYSLPNYTKGNLVATAYRTKLIDSWGYKFYRYDERGNVIKLWHYIAGLGWKAEDYYYNSQNQLTRNRYQPGGGDEKLFTYGYDDAGRLDYVNQYMGSQPEDPEEQGDYPSSYFSLVKYAYNPNSQLDSLIMNDRGLKCKYLYNNRNWIKQFYKSGTPLLYGYNLNYNANGNIRWQQMQGNYSANFASTVNPYHKFIYDNSNRLLKAENDSGSVSTRFDLINGYDKDGNILSLKRYGSSNNLADDFTYNYYSGTNKLHSVFGSKVQYTYDANGNMTMDDVNKNYNILYDHRNLMTDIRTIRQEMGLGGPEDKTYWTIYKYDDAGNRIRKITYKYNGSEPDPEFDENGDNPSWELVTNEFYVRDVSGKEIALYSGSSLTQWNIWGLDNVGKINTDTTRSYYLKDHLGSIRVVLNSTNTVISAQDYDAWGYVLENRSYNSSAIKYDFTGKERDNETNYDYFGARYYDSRIGRWGQVEPLLDRNVNVTPYGYSSNNPIVRIDIGGLDDYYYLAGTNTPIHIPNPFGFAPNRYYVEHMSGNKSGPNFEGISGKNFYQTASEQTMEIYFKSTNSYNPNDVVTDFESVGFIERFTDAIPGENDPRSNFDYAKEESPPGGNMDQKQNLSPSGLYIFGGKANDFQETGNIVWGAAMYHLDFSLIASKLAAHVFTLGKYGHFDQPNEQVAIERGYKHAESKSFARRAE